MRTILFIFVAFTSSIYAQEPFSYKLDYENGFNSNEVYEIEQDSFGFIWIGCDAGLFRYDGVQFKQYKHPEQNGVSISSLTLDKKQRLWYQNFTGQLFYIENDTSYLFKDFTEEISTFPIYNIQEDSIVLHLGYTAVYDIKTKKLVSKAKNINSKTKDYFVVLNIEMNSIETYINSRDNIHYKKGRKPYHSLFETGKYSCFNLKKINQEVYALLKDEKSNEWLLVKLENGKTILLKTYSPKTFPSTIYMIQAAQDGFIICTTDGVYLLDNQFNLTSHYFSNEKITDALFDKEGNLWLTSLQNGLYVIPSIELSAFSSDFFPNSNMTTLAVDGDELLLGTYLGDIYRFNPESNTYKNIYIGTKHNYRNIRKIINKEDYQVFSIGESTIYIDKKTKERIDFDAPNVRDMLIFNDTLFSIGTSAFQKTGLKNNRMEYILGSSSRMLTKSPITDTIFVGTKNGFFRYYDGKTQEILKDGQSIFPFCSAWQQDTLWLGTVSDGFMAYHDGRFFKHFYKKKEDNGILIRSVKVYENWLLLATRIGFIRMDLTTQEMDIIGTNEGLYQKEVTGIEVLNDEVFLSTTNSLISFPLEMSAQNIVTPNIDLHSITLNDSIRVSRDRDNFKYFENNLLFKFQTALFRSRRQFHYEYRLLGLNDKWQKTNAASPFTQYRSLDAGEYVFEVRAVNEDDVKSHIERYSFSIRLPIWERWWFILILIVIAAAFIYWRFNVRLQDIQQKAQLENDLKTSQLTALKAQMNPHFLYNSLNSIQDLILQEDIDNANEYLTKFSHLMRQILEASEYFEIPLSREAQILELYLTLEKLRFGSKFQYEIQFPKELDLATIKVPSMIIQPFVENAVKHGLLHKISGLKQLKVVFELTDSLICTITDNGIGRAAAKKIKARQGRQTTSFATSATQKRLDILNQTSEQQIGLEIIDLYENDKAIGTKVILQIPFTNFDI